MTNIDTSTKNSSPKTLYSLTGHAVIETLIRDRKFRVQIYSLNHRYFELNWRAPRNLQHLEVNATPLIKALLKRGAITIMFEEMQSSDGMEAPHSIHNFFGSLQRALQESDTIKGLGFIPRSIRALLISHYPEYWLRTRAENNSPLLSIEDIEPLLKELSEKLMMARALEGQKIQMALLKLVDGLQFHLSEVKKNLPNLRDEWERAIRERLNKLIEELGGTKPEENRLLQEFVLIAEKRNVEEEIQRAQMHIDSTRELLNDPKENTGKRLEFMTQELHREFTTLGNKIKNPTQAQSIIEAKLLIEQIREQCANIL